ncbi:MAG: hypothetical protein RL119_38 [Actinomycetota bacterium]
MANPDSQITIADLWIEGSIDPWLNLGFAAQSDEFLCLPDLGLRFLSSPASVETSPRITGWTLLDPTGDEKTCDEKSGDAELSVDGLKTRFLSRATCVDPSTSPLNVLGVDHIVVMTGNLERTCEAITAVTRSPLKRIRDAGGGVRQGFHRCGKVIIEVVERPDIDAVTPASIWGLVLNVGDLDQCIDWLGPDVISAPRPAVQAGRRIATIKREVGLGIAVALMTPEPAR